MKFGDIVLILSDRPDPLVWTIQREELYSDNVKYFYLSRSDNGHYYGRGSYKESDLILADDPDLNAKLAEYDELQAEQKQRECEERLKKYVAEELRAFISSNLVGKSIEHDQLVSCIAESLAKLKMEIDVIKGINNGP